MTQEEAIIKALEEYGGRASNKQIYERAMMYAEFGGKTPEATIRWWLQKSKHIKPTEGKRGWWELISYQEEIAKRDAEIARLRKENEVKDGLIVYMRSEAYLIVIISDWMKRYMNVCKRKSQSVRETIQRVIADIAIRLKFNYSDDTQEILNRFDDEKTPEITFIKKEYKDNATSADIEIPGLMKQDLVELLTAQQQNLLGNNTPKQLK